MQLLSGEGSNEDESTLFGADVLPAAANNAGAAAMPPFRLQPVAWHTKDWEGRGWHAHHYQMKMMLHGGEPGEHGHGHPQHGWGAWGRKEMEEVPPTVPADWMPFEVGRGSCTGSMGQGVGRQGHRERTQ
jgi:hypothetical protein